MPTIDWEAVAKRLGHASEKAMWISLYTVREQSITDISEQFGVSKATIRNALLRNDVDLRDRGGPNHQVGEAGPPDLEQRIDREGIQSVANALGISVAAVYKRLKKMKARRKKAHDAA